MAYLAEMSNGRFDLNGITRDELNLITCLLCKVRIGHGQHKKTAENIMVALNDHLIELEMRKEELPKLIVELLDKVDYKFEKSTNYFMLNFKGE